MSRTLLLKKYLFIFFIALVFLASTNAFAKNIDDCDYDNTSIGSANIEIKGDKALISYGAESGHSSYAEVDAKDPLVGMVNEALENTEEDKELGYKEIAILNTLNTPVCAYPIDQGVRFISGYVEKDNYYAVALCLPESGSCWHEKINKNSALGGQIRLYGIDKFPANKVYNVISHNFVIIELYEYTED